MSYGDGLYGQGTYGGPLVPAGPTLTQLSASTVNRKWIVEVNTGTIAAPTWTPVNGVTNVVPNSDNANLVDDSDYAGGGFSASTKTSAGWSVALTLSRKPDQATQTLYDTGQEALRIKGIGQFGPANQVQIRYYEFTPGGGPRTEAYMGFAAVQWAEQGGAYNAISSVVCTLTGQGQLSQIAHPYPATATVPVVNSVTPATAHVAGGDLIRISGQNLSGTTGVTFGPTAAPYFTVVNDSLVVAEAPAKTAGSYNVIVTNGAGSASNTPAVVFS